MGEFLGLSGTIGRKPFVLWIIASFFLTIVIGVIAAGAAIAADQPDLLGAASYSVLIPGLALFAAMQTALAAKRIRDTARTGWLVVPFAVVLVASCSLTMAGQDGPAAGLSSLMYWILLIVIAAMPSRSGELQREESPRPSRRDDFMTNLRTSPRLEQAASMATSEAPRKSFGRR